jgi:putative protein-disulfide isomerase
MDAAHRSQLLFITCFIAFSMSNSLPTLYYIHDPMCSWCWGFRPVWDEVQAALAGKVTIRYLLGGLAADTQESMPESMQRSIRNTWQRIQQEIPGTEFNYNFWTQCHPRRSTYPACRAILACRMQQPESEQEMLLAIQQAYYLEARNPSDVDVLIQLADKIGLDRQRFTADIQSQACQNMFLEEIQLCRDINTHSFPSLVLKQGKSYTLLDLDYTNSNIILNQIK